MVIPLCCNKKHSLLIIFSASSIPSVKYYLTKLSSLEHWLLLPPRCSKTFIPLIPTSYDMGPAKFGCSLPYPIFRSRSFSSTKLDYLFSETIFQTQHLLLMPFPPTLTPDLYPQNLPQPSRLVLMPPIHLSEIFSPSSRCLFIFLISLSYSALYYPIWIYSLLG